MTMIIDENDIFVSCYQNQLIIDHFYVDLHKYLDYVHKINVKKLHEEMVLFQY